VITSIALLLCGGGLLAGCSSSLDPISTVQGRYDLVRYDAKDLPAKVLQIPTRDGQPTACWYAAASGNLVLGSGTFSYRLTFENTCTGGVL